MEKRERFAELDMWRGIAIIGMIIYHGVFMIDYVGYASITYHQGAWLVGARLIQLSFLLLVGISLHLSFQKSRRSKATPFHFLLRQFKRGILVFSCGLLITLATGIFIPEDFVRFGILHFIGISIILLSFVASRPWAALVISFLVFVCSDLVRQTVVTSAWLIPFGFRFPFQSVDYFPIFPWLAVPAFGIFLGALLYPDYQRRWNTLKLEDSANPVMFLGKHSLFVYLLHVPVLLGLIALWKHLF